MIEATEAADQLPLSYPATLVATMPCTVPAWLAHSQKTTASALHPTQQVPNPTAQPSAASARLPMSSAQATTIDKPLLPSASTGRALSQGTTTALQDRPKCRLVSRLSQLGEGLAEIQPDQVHGASLPAASSIADQQKQAATSGQAEAAATAAAGAGLQHKALPEPSARVVGNKPDTQGPAGKGPTGQPVKARDVGSSLEGPVAERGKRAAECSPGAYDVVKGTHKRARSDSPSAKPDWERQGPSDADVQVKTSSG